jgi:NAD(P)H-hydrate epimerase
MTAEGALRSGAGLVTVGCPVAIHGTLENKLTEAMTCPLPEVDGRLSLQALGAIEELWQGRQAMALGPGLEQAEETVALVRRLVRDCPLPLVIDADGLNALGETPEILGERPKNSTILTPHPGEMARLSGKSVAEIEADRLTAARDFATRYGVVLVLKGARTVTAFADGDLRINGSGNPGMASGGMGDVLTGLIGGLLVQGLPPQSAATLGVYLHGLAADRVAGRYGDAGLIATDVLRELPAARMELADFAP